MNKCSRTRADALFGLPLVLQLVGSLGCNGGIERAAIPVDHVEVRVRAQDTAWSGAYLFSRGGNPDAGAALEVLSGREVHLPLGAQVTLSLESRDYICIYAMPGVGLHDFAAPGLPTQVRFRAEHLGSYEFRGDEMCGLPHTEKTRGRFIVEEPDAFRTWVHEQSKKANR